MNISVSAPRSCPNQQNPAPIARIPARVRASLRALCAGLCALGLSQAIHAERLHFIAFDVPGAGTASGEGTGCNPYLFIDCSVLINNSGAITGFYEDAQQVFHGFVRSPEGKVRAFDSPGADLTPGNTNGTFPLAINDAGVITGFYVDANFAGHGFVRSPEGGFVTFDAPGSLTTVPIEVNLAGQIAGYYVDPTGTFEGFLRRPDGRITTWAQPGACSANPVQFCAGTGAVGINDSGVITGAYEDANYVGHGLIRSPKGKFTAFDVRGAGSGQYEGTGCPGCAVPINQLGAVGGFYIDSSFVVHGYLRNPSGRITTFDIPGEGPYGIGCFNDCSLGLNDEGELTGYYADANNVFHGFLRTPDGEIMTFDAPGADTTAQAGHGTFPNSINDHGVITGNYLDANGVVHGFLALPSE